MASCALSSVGSGVAGVASANRATSRQQGRLAARSARSLSGAAALTPAASVTRAVTRRSSRRNAALGVSAVASPSMPSTASSLPGLVNIPDFLRGPLENIVKQVEASLPADARKQLLRTQYTTAIGLRLAFFLTQGVLSSQVSGRSSIDGTAAAAAIVKAVLDPAPQAQRVQDKDSNIGNIVKNAADGRQLTESEASEVSQFLNQHLAAIVNLFRTELAHLEEGNYKFPYDLNPATGPREQWNLLEVASLARDTLDDQKNVADRRAGKRGQDLLETFSPDPARYPAYYLQNFHYQTDGWLTADSARLYDFQVETLFLGSADTMRRQALPYITKFMKGRSAADTKLLDVASGTGRFLTFVRDNFPELQCTALELSPNYLEAVRKSNQRFEGGGGSLRLVEANCEAMPFADMSFDAVTNVYLFHEMPKEARRNAAKEMARVLKPGGQLFFVDSAQVGDGAALGMEKAFDQALERFPQFNHEPYYKDYSVTDLAALFGEFGMEMEASTIAWVSKVMVFTKKASGGGGAAAASTPPAAAAAVMPVAAAAAAVMPAVSAKQMESLETFTPGVETAETLETFTPATSTPAAASVVGMQDVVDTLASMNVSAVAAREMETSTAAAPAAAGMQDVMDTLASMTLEDNVEECYGEVCVETFDEPEAAVDDDVLETAAM